MAYERINSRWEVGLGLSDGQFHHISFVNGIFTTNGGQHVNYIVDQVVTKAAEAASRKNKQQKGAEIKPFQVRSHLFVFVNCLVDNPAFDSQTKDTLMTRPRSFGSEGVLSDGTIRKARPVHGLGRLGPTAPKNDDWIVHCWSDLQRRSRGSFGDLGQGQGNCSPENWQWQENRDHCWRP